MPQGATSLLAPAPTKRMGFSIESLVGGRTTPPKSESPPLMHHQISSNRILSDSSKDLRCFQTENGFNARDLLFQRDLMALREHHQQQQQQHQQQLANESILREQILLRQRMQEHLTHEQLKRTVMTRDILNHDFSREILCREQSQFELRELNSESNVPPRRIKTSPRNSPRSSPRNSPPLPQTSSSPQSFTEEDRTNSSPNSSIKKPQPSTPPTSPGISNSFLNPLHGPILPGLQHQFMALGGTPGGPPPIHIPTPMVQHPLLGGAGLPQSLTTNPLGSGVALGLGTPLPPVSRDFPLYPWLLSRHGRVFQPGFPSPDYPGFLMPFRKPKRIRTAFSPSQLLKLEQAFEKNQYVVGQERKQLAINLCLSETQVKVWFQNRRTKHKRQQQEDEEGGPGSKGTTDGDKGGEDGLILEHEEDEEELDVLDEAGEQ